ATIGESTPSKSNARSARSGALTIADRPATPSAVTGVGSGTSEFYRTRRFAGGPPRPGPAPAGLAAPAGPQRGRSGETGNRDRGELAYLVVHVPGSQRSGPTGRLGRGEQRGHSEAQQLHPDDQLGTVHIGHRPDQQRDRTRGRVGLVVSAARGQ